MGNLLTKREKSQSDHDRKSPKGCFRRLFCKNNNKVKNVKNPQSKSQVSFLGSHSQERFTNESMCIPKSSLSGEILRTSVSAVSSQVSRFSTRESAKSEDVTLELDGVSNLGNGGLSADSWTSSESVNTLLFYYQLKSDEEHSRENPSPSERKGEVVVANLERSLHTVDSDVIEHEEEEEEAANNNDSPERENIGETSSSVLSLPLAIDQSTLADEVDVRVSRTCEAYGYDWPRHVEAGFHRQSMRVNGRNACAFLTLMVLKLLLEWEQIQMMDLRLSVERIIREVPQVINPHRQMEAFYDVYTALDILTDLGQVPLGSLQELLLRNPPRWDLREDLRAALTRIWESSMRVACAFICEPLVLTVFCCSAEGQRWLGIVDTHRVPEELGGRGGGLVLCFAGSADNPEPEAVTQLVTWLMSRLDVENIPMNERTSLVSLYLD